MCTQLIIQWHTAMMKFIGNGPPNERRGLQVQPPSQYFFVCHSSVSLIVVVGWVQFREINHPGNNLSLNGGGLIFEG